LTVNVRVVLAPASRWTRWKPKSCFFTTGAPVLATREKRRRCAWGLGGMPTCTKLYPWCGNDEVYAAKLFVAAKEAARRTKATNQECEAGPATKKQKTSESREEGVDAGGLVPHAPPALPALPALPRQAGLLRLYGRTRILRLALSD
jgi:hypothetical protein